MSISRSVAVAVLVGACLSSARAADAQGTIADYQRAMGLRDKYQRLAVSVPEAATWIEKTTRFWYRRSVKGGTEFVVMDAATQTKRPAFDHEKLATALTLAITPEKPYTGVTLPFNAFNFVDGERAIEVSVNNALWQCTIVEYSCRLDRRAVGVAAADAVDGAAALAGRFVPNSISTVWRPVNLPTASSKRSSTTTTWRFARSGSRASLC
jgi:hypothetical protein